jgi:membrane protease YdiL (CAAX protease family)
MKTLIDFGIGILLFILQSLLQIPIIFIFRDPFSDYNGPTPTLIYEYLIGAVVIFVISLGFAWIFKTKDKARAWRRAIIWALTSALLTFTLQIIDVVDAGIFNWSALGPIFAHSFGNVGYYLILLGIFLGPIAFARIKKLS